MNITRLFAGSLYPHPYLRSGNILRYQLARSRCARHSNLQIILQKTLTNQRNEHRHNKSIAYSIPPHLLALLCLLFLVPVHAVSFDCTPATTKVEKMICADSELSLLDEKLSKTFIEILKMTEDKELLKKEQLEWMRERNKCQDKVCTKKSYKNRVAELEVFLSDNTKSASDINLVDGNIVNAYFGTLCYHRSNAAIYQVRYISAEESIPATKRCTFANKETVYIDYSGDLPSEQGACGAAPGIDFSLWVGNKRVISKKALTQQCNSESTIKFIKIQNNTITTCIYPSTGDGINLTIDKNKVSCSSKAIRLINK